MSSATSDMQQAQEIHTRQQVSTTLQRRFEAMKALEQWRKRYGEKLKNWDFVAVIRHFREHR